MKVAAIIQARMGSTRLPGKVLKKVLGKPLLEYQIERVLRAKSIDEVIIATTTNRRDNPIIQLCQQLSIPFYRGSEQNVLSRYYETAKQFNADKVVRLTSDCPIIDPEIIDRVVLYFLKNQHKYDFVANTLKRTYPRGMDTEVLSYEVLKKIHEQAIEKLYREHVTSYLYSHPDEFSLFNIEHERDESKYRLTVDTPEDFDLIEKIITTLYPMNKTFTLNDVIRLLEEKPVWATINSNIEQKKSGD